MLLTTQYLDEADHLADRIAIVDAGRIIAEGTSASLKAAVGSGRLHVRLEDAADRSVAERIMTDALDGEPVSLDSDPLSLSASAGDAGRAADVVSQLARAGIAVAEFGLGQPSLDEVFLALTGHGTEPVAS